MPTKNSNGRDLVYSQGLIVGTNEFSISLAAVITGVNGTPTCLES